MIYTEDTLISWTAPLSKTEEERVENAVQMIRDAVTSYEKLSDCVMDIFVQGSYANNTNVRQNSDVDVTVMLKSSFYPCYVDGKNNKDYGYIDGTMTYDNYKKYIIEALRKKFVNSSISIGNKSLNLEANSYRVNADVVPAFQYRNYKTISSLDPEKYIEGIKYFAEDGTEIINYPKEHIKNGIFKNKNTNLNYKKLVRIMKRLRNNMVDAGLVEKDKITSFLIESLVWNIPNSIIVENKTWTDTVKNSIVYLWNAINDEKHQEWGEVSERLYLFHKERKWTDIETKDFLSSMFIYLKI